MNINNSRRVAALFCTLLLAASLGSLFFAGIAFAYTDSGVTVSVFPDQIIAENTLRVGFKLDHEWRLWRDSSVLRQFAEDGGFGIINSYTAKSDSPRPCSYWNATTKTGIFNWASVDSLVKRIIEVGAEPMLSLSLYDMQAAYLPKGMPVNSTTNLPYPDQFAAYAAEWPRHFKNVELPVKWYEINEEGFQYFGWNAAYGLTRLQNYIDVWNAAARAMRNEDSTIKVSDDSVTMPRVFDYWLLHGDDVDFLDFHKYDSYSLTPESPGYLPDAQLIEKADTRAYETSPSFYGTQEAQQKWLLNRGKLIPVINHETNLNSHWSGGTDPRMQTMVGAVWTALMLRISAIKQLDYVLYYSFAGAGPNYFGMIDYYTNTPHFPYYVLKWFGNNLAVGDNLINSTSSSSDVPTLAWIHNETVNILLISKVDQNETVYLNGLSGQVNLQKIDNSTDWRAPSVQNELIDASSPINMRGYTVALLQQKIEKQQPSPQYIFSEGFETGNFSKWNGTLVTAGASLNVLDTLSYNGNYSALFTFSGFTLSGISSTGRTYSYAYFNSTSEIYVRSYFYIGGGLPLTREWSRFNFIALRSATTGTIMSSVSILHYNGTDVWALLTPNGVFRTDSGPSMGQWYSVEYYAKINSTQGGYALWINGQNLINQTSLDTSTYGNIDSVRIGLTYVYAVSNLVTTYADSIVVSVAYVEPEPSV